MIIQGINREIFEKEIKCTLINFCNQLDYQKKIFKKSTVKMGSYLPNKFCPNTSCLITHKLLVCS